MDYRIDTSGTLYIAEHSEESSIQIQGPKPPSRLDGTDGIDYLIVEDELSPDEIHSIEMYTIKITDSSKSSDWIIPIPYISEKSLTDEQPPTTDNSTKSSKKGGAQDECLVILLFAILLRTQNTKLNSRVRKIFKTN